MGLQNNNQPSWVKIGPNLHEKRSFFPQHRSSSGTRKKMQFIILCQPSQYKKQIRCVPSTTAYRVFPTVVQARTDDGKTGVFGDWRILHSTTLIPPVYDIVWMVCGVALISSPSAKRIEEYLSREENVPGGLLEKDRWSFFLHKNSSEKKYPGACKSCFFGWYHWYSML